MFQIQRVVTLGILLSSGVLSAQEKKPLEQPKDTVPIQDRDEEVARGFSSNNLRVVAGMAGYHYLEELSWIDTFTNSAIILGAMGPVAQIQTFGGKLFAGFYA
jgi:hypothetical protein